MAIGGFNASPGSFGSKGVAVNPNDTADIPSGPVRAVSVVVAGNLSIVPTGNANNDPINYVGVSIGFIPPYQVRRVMATGTTATVRTVED